MHVPFKAINVFHTAAKLGSITRAAAELGVTPSAVSQQIQALEVQLGTSLTAKVGRNIVLTEAGTRYFASITEEIERISEATRTVRGLHTATTLSVRATPTLSNSWLLPRLGGFLTAYPDIDVRLDASTEATDFSRDAVDLEIRHGDGRWPGMFVEGLAETRFIPVAAPSLIAAESAVPADFFEHRLIHSVKAQFGWSHWFARVGIEPPRYRRLLFDRSHMAIGAAVRGLGIALESTLMMEAELREGRLCCPVRSPPDVRLTTQWIICPADHLRQRKVRVFLDWLRHERAVWQASVGALGW
jgi:DNA-binding transcriptional LysR family regulator